MSGKYNKFLTILLIVIAIIILGIIGWFAYSSYTSYSKNKEASNFVDSFVNQEDKIDDKKDEPEVQEPDEDIELPVDDPAVKPTNPGGGDHGGGSAINKIYKGYNVVGAIQIPKTNLSYPILNENGVGALQVAVSRLCGPNANEPGNMVILGHNYNNEYFFSKNDELRNGDKIYITDLSGQKLAYTIYDKFTTEQSNTDWITRDTKGKREISLQTCTPDGKLRLIILAKCDLD